MLATNLSEYLMNGVKLPTVIGIASGSDTWQIVSHVLFGDDWACVGGNDMKLTRSFQNEIDWNTLITWTVHLVMEELLSNPGVNCKTTE